MTCREIVSTEDGKARLRQQISQPRMLLLGELHDVAAVGTLITWECAGVGWHNRCEPPAALSATKLLLL